MRKTRALLLVAMPLVFAGTAQAEQSEPGKPLRAKSSVNAAIAIPAATAAIDEPAGAKRQASGRVIAAQNITPVTPPQAALSTKGKPLDAKQKVLVEKINGYLTGVQTLVGDFVQVGPDGRRAEGKFYLQKPGRMRFEYNDPSPLELIADGTSVAVRDRKLATQDLLLLSQTPLRFLLSDRMDLMKEGNLVNVYSDDVFVTVVLEEKNIVAGTHRLMLMFSAKDLQLKQWTVTDPQGYDTTVALYNLDAGKRPDPRLFTINYEQLRN
jgi:outer membrane lipoprotein-sorting protein